MMLEADVTLHGFDTEDEKVIPIMAHPPSVFSDITLGRWLDLTLATEKGIKLDFKSIAVLKPALKLLQERRDLFRQPVWLNADILIGPNTDKKAIDHGTFIRTVQEQFPQCTLSLGWTIEWTNTASDAGYTQAMVEEMHEICRDLRQPVTFPIRAAAARLSWKELTWLLDQSRRYSLSVWTSSSDKVDKADIKFFRMHAELSRLYLDLPAELMTY